MDDMGQSEIYHIDNGVPSETNTSEDLYSGAYPPTYGNNTGAEYTIFPNNQNGLVQSDIYGDNGEVIISTYTSGTIQTSGVVITMTPTVCIPHFVTPIPS